MINKDLKNKSAIVYAAINSVSGKKYIGVTCKNLVSRISHHKDYAKKSNCHFQNAIKKYGIDGFNFYTLSKWENYQDALNEEIRVISLVKPEYNKTLGGQGMLGNYPSEETREKIGRSHKGKKISDEAKAKMSKAKLGKSSSRKGIAHTEESKKKMSDALKGKVPYMAGRRHTEETLKKMSLSKIGIPSKNRKPVICLDDNIVFNSISSAKIFYNLKKIGEVCNGKRKTCGGKRFAWYTEKKEVA